jgi:diguanylate cyclase (GGDEF)-like protein
VIERKPGSRLSIKVFTLAVGGAAALVGVTVVAGRALGVAAMQSASGGLAAMKVNTALGIALLGVALCATRGGAVARRAGKVAAAVAAGIGIVTLLEYGLNWNAGIDELLSAATQTPAAAFPGRPSHATAFTLVALAVALLRADSRSRRSISAGAALLAALLSWVALNGYLFGVWPLNGAASYSGMALPSAALLFLLSLGVTVMEPRGWPARIVLSRNMGGMLSRWLLPAAVLAPPLLGWLIGQLQSLGAYDDPFGWTLYAVVSSAGSVGLILLLAHRMSVMDAERVAATELSRHDPLTGLLNRRAFDVSLDQLFRLAKRHVRPLSLLMLDVDNFKSYNDTFGHPAGDELLQRLAELLGKHPRATDLVARVGGEEFAMLLPETELPGALVLAERVRRDVERYPGFRRPMTISIGVASMTASTSDAAVLVQASDTALYAAKGQGRNHVAWVGARAADSGSGIGLAV